MSGGKKTEAPALWRMERKARRKGSVKGFFSVWEAGKSEGETFASVSAPSLWIVQCSFSFFSSSCSSSVFFLVEAAATRERERAARSSRKFTKERPALCPRKDATSVRDRARATESPREQLQGREEKTASKSNAQRWVTQRNRQLRSPLLFFLLIFSYFFLASFIIHFRMPHFFTSDRKFDNLIFSYDDSDCFQSLATVYVH